MKTRAEELIARRWSIPPDLLQVNVEPVQGGLEASVAIVNVTSAGHEPAIPSRIVIKKVSAGCRREAQVYQLLWSQVDEPPAARLIAAESLDDAEYLLLEHLPEATDWPWTDTAAAAAVCRALARLHETPAIAAAVLGWDYETDLARSAQETLALAASARTREGVRGWTRLGDLRRVVEHLPEMRTRLLGSGRTLIHGDVHPGNVMIRCAGGGVRVTLIDWARARVGSPLEDVASWLHSLGCWEPQARRRHDTLLRLYLACRGRGETLTPQFRMDYWLASVSNGLAGAIRYHIAVVCDARSGARQRAQSWQAIRAWQRVVKHAATLIRRSARRT